jgi:nucleosome binding factor SPN SPT16 subunit
MIERKNLDDIKQWLADVPLTFTQTSRVLNVKGIMKTVR